jgi:hypothetical protein
MRHSRLEKPILSAAIFIAWLIVPLLFFWLLARVGFLYAMGPLLLLKLVVYPHDWIVHRVPNYSTALFSSGMALFIATLQWSFVSVIYALCAQHLKPSRHLLVAPLVIILVSLLVSCLIYTCGYIIEVDWL